MDAEASRRYALRGVGAGFRLDLFETQALAFYNRQFAPNINHGMTESEISRLWLWSKNMRSECSGSVSLAVAHQFHPHTGEEVRYSLGSAMSPIALPRRNTHLPQAPAENPWAIIGHMSQCSDQRERERKKEREGDREGERTV